MTLVPSLAASSDHLINHSSAVSSLGNTGRRTGSVSAGDHGVVDIVAVGNAGSGQNQDSGVDEMIAAVRKAWDERHN